MAKTIFYKTKTGREIAVTEETWKHLEAHPDVKSILREVLLKVPLPEDSNFTRQEVNMGRTVGKTGLVRVGYEEKMMFAYRKGREGPTRVVPASTPKADTSIVSIVAGKDEEGSWILYTAFLGILGTREPWDPNIETQEERDEALRFWCHQYALVHDPETMGPIFISTCEEEFKNK